LELAQRDFERCSEKPTNVLDREWDNLVLLDAARHDIYEDVRGKEVESIVSVGGHSREFVEKTFSSRKDFSDVVYVTGNPHVSPEKFGDLTGESFSRFETVFETFRDSPAPVPPEEVKEDALTVEKLFPDSRKIVHFMQPHAPFIGSDLEVDYKQYSWGEGDRERVEKAYRDNLEFALDNALDLASELSGRTIVSADHGELLGENGLFKHYYGLNCEPLRRVPWDIVKD
jgi:hypothetical protein